jgi:hypothetical protein
MADSVLETLVVELTDNGDAFITDLQRTITRAKTELSGLKVDIDFGDTANAAKRVKAAVDPLDESIRELQQRLQIGRNSYVANAISADEFKKGLVNLRSEMNTLIKANDLTIPQYAKISNAMATAQRATDTLEGRASKLGLAQQVNIALGNRFQNTLQSFGPAGSAASGALGLVAGGLAQITAQNVGLGVSISLLRALPAVLALAAPVGGLLAIGALSRLTKEAGEFAEGLEEVATRTRLTTDSVQELQYVGELAGFTINDVETAINGMTTRLRGAEEGSDKQTAAFQRLGIATKDLEGRLLPTEQIFLDSVDALQKLTNESEQQVAAQSIFGKSASNLTALLNLTAEEFAVLRDEANDLGLVLSGESISRLAAYNDKVAIMQQQFRNARFEIADAFLPVMTEGVLPMLQAGIPLIKGVADRILDFTDQLFEASEEGVAFRSSVAGNIASAVLFGTRLFALGEIAVGLTTILASPFASLIEVLSQASRRMDAFVAGWQALLKGDFAAVAENNAIVGGAFDFESIIKAFTDTATAGRKIAESGFGLLAVDEDTVEQFIINKFNEAAAAVAEGSGRVREEGERAGEDLGLSFGDGLSKTKEDVAKAAKEWTTRLSAEVENGLRDADDALGLLSPRISELQTELKSAFDSGDAGVFNDTLAKLETLEAAYNRIFQTLPETSLGITPVVSLTNALPIPEPAAFATLSDSVDVTATAYATLSKEVDVATGFLFRFNETGGLVPRTFVTLADAIDVTIEPTVQLADAIDLAITPTVTLGEEVDIVTGFLKELNDTGGLVPRTFVQVADAVDLAITPTVDLADAVDLAITPTVQYRNALGELVEKQGELGETSQNLVNTFKGIGDIASSLANVLPGELGEVAGGFADAASAGASFVTNIASGNVLGAIASAVDLIGSLAKMVGDFSTNAEEFKTSALEANRFLSEAAYNAQKVTQTESVGGIPGLFGVTKETVNEEATQIGIDAFNTIANTLAQGIENGGDVDLSQLWQNMLLEAFILSPEVQEQILAFQKYLQEVFADGIVSPEEALQLDEWEKTFDEIGKKGAEVTGVAAEQAAEDAAKAAEDAAEEAERAAKEAADAFEREMQRLSGSIANALNFDADTFSDFFSDFDLGIDEVIKQEIIKGFVEGAGSAQIRALAEYIQSAIASDGIDANEQAEIERRKQEIVNAAQETYNTINELFPNIDPGDVPTPENIDQTEVDFSRVPQSIQLAVAAPLLEASLNDLQASTVFVEGANTFRDAVSEGFALDISGLQTVINQWETIQTRTNTMYERVLNEGFTVNVTTQAQGGTSSRTLLSRY